jgi:hypothetical protein
VFLSESSEPENSPAATTSLCLWALAPQLLRSLIEISKALYSFDARDILDELFIMTLIKTQQETVIRTFVKNCQRLQNWDSPGDADNRSDRSSPRLSPIKPKQRRMSSLTAVPYLTLDQQYDPEDVNWTKICARELLDNLGDQVLELQSLKNAAENTSVALKDLLALKQQ